LYSEHIVDEFTLTVGKLFTGYSDCGITIVKSVAGNRKYLPTVSVNSSTICSGSTTTLTANGANTYTWNTTATGVSITPSQLLQQIIQLPEQM